MLFTLPLLSHPDEIANFDFPQHAVALQRFRINPIASAYEQGVELTLQWRHNERDGV